MENTVLVIGTGQMGTGISTLLAYNNINVYLYSRNKNSVNEALKTIESTLNKLISREKINETQKKNILDKISTVTNISEISQPSLIIESIIENFEVKRDLISNLEKHFGPEVIIASNTSSLSITKLADGLNYPERMIGLHFFNPAFQMKLVEVVPTKYTKSEYVNRAIEFCNKLNKTSVLVNDTTGFIVNRILIPMINEAVCILEEGVATAKEIDLAMQLGANHPLGPLALADLIGIDIVFDIMNSLQNGLNNNKYTASNLLLEMIQENHLGRKTGQGFFKY